MNSQSKRLVLRDLSVTHKISAIILLVLLMLAAFQLLYLPRRIATRENRALEDKARALARVVSTSLAQQDQLTASQAKRLFRGLRADHDYRFAALFDITGHLIAGHRLPSSMTDLDGAPPKIPRITWLENEVHLKAPVKSTGKSQGTILLGFSRAEGLGAVSSSRRAGIVIALIALILAGSVVLWFASSFRRRLNGLEVIAQQVAAGNLSHPPLSDPRRDEIGRVAASVDTVLVQYRRLEELVDRVANGDLSVRIDMQGDLASSFNRMVAGQRDLVQQIMETSALVASVAGEFFATAQQQQRGAVEQSGAVEENRRTMESLSKSGQQTADMAQSVLRNAEKTQQNSQVVAERITALSSHTQRIGEVLEVIREIANKSDLLALNAALEGTKAGESGRGFSLVASQMQRLAENVMGSVRDIKEMTVTIGEATKSTVTATEETTKLAADTTRSSRQIALIMQQQQLGTEQVSQALDEVSQIAGEAATASKEIVRSARDLTQLSDQLTRLIGRFSVDKERLGEPDTPSGTGSSEPRSEASDVLT